MKYIRNSNGISIVEVVAGFVILAVILISFMGILVQTKKTNASSETIQDATYVAQAEMEGIYLIANSVGSIRLLDTATLTTSTTTYTKQNDLSSPNILQCEDYSGTYGHSIEKTAVYEGIVNNYTANLAITLTCRSKHNIIGTVNLELIDRVNNMAKVKIENAYIWK
jgi:Tfp pilus assembly protein PilV